MNIPDGTHVDDGSGSGLPACGEVWLEGPILRGLKQAREALDPEVVAIVAELGIQLGKPCAKCVEVLELREKFDRTKTVE